VRRSELPFADIVLLDWNLGIVSGHVLGVVVGYGMLGYAVYAALRRPGWRTLDILVVAAIVGAITIARLYLEQHYISDATAGLAAGLIWVTTCISAIEVARQRHWAE
jgi:undecaprenyl-diphosphatase